MGFINICRSDKQLAPIVLFLLRKGEPRKALLFLFAFFSLSLSLFRFIDPVALDCWDLFGVCDARPLPLSQIDPPKVNKKGGRFLFVLYFTFLLCFLESDFHSIHFSTTSN